MLLKYFVCPLYKRLSEVSHAYDTKIDEGFYFPIEMFKHIIIIPFEFVKINIFILPVK